MSPHLIGWGALLLVIFLQNDLSDWEFQDYYSIIGLIVFIGIAVYVNLYFLIPRYLFLKKYSHYALFVSILILSTSLLIAIWMSKFDQIDWLSRFDQYFNEFIDAYNSNDLKKYFKESANECGGDSLIFSYSID